MTYVTQPTPACFSVITSSTTVTNSLTDAWMWIESQKKYKELVCTTLLAVFVSDDTGHLNGIFEDDQLWVSQSSLITDELPEYVASLLVHEACHIRDARNKTEGDLATLEKQALTTQLAFIRQSGSKHTDYLIKWLQKQDQGRWWEVSNDDTYKTTMEGYRKTALDVIRKQSDF